MHLAPLTAKERAVPRVQILVFLAVSIRLSVGFYGQRVLRYGRPRARGADSDNGDLKW
jgi:hypothetical protein